MLSKRPWLSWGEHQDRGAGWCGATSCSQSFVMKFQTLTMDVERFIFSSLPALLPAAERWSSPWLWCQPPTSAPWWRSCSSSSPPAPPSSDLTLPVASSLQLKGEWSTADTERLPHTYMNIHVYICTYICIYEYTCTYVYIYAFKYISVHVNIYCIRPSPCVSTQWCLCVSQ